MTAEAREVDIVGLGAQGDGIAETAGERIYIPYALPGERWRFVDDGRPEMLRPHPARATPVCPHFGSCGGCVAQHMPDALYVAWKRAIVADAFGHRSIDAPIGDLVRVPLASRRRITVYARRDRKSVRLGFYRAATHYIMDIAECPIAEPQLVAALPALREMVEPLLTGQAEAGINMLATPAGVDVSIIFIYLGSVRQHYPRMVAVAAQHGFARLTVERDTLLLARQPVVALGGVDVAVHPEAFMQAVEASEREMVRLVLDATAKAKRVADLFCGIGTFTFPLARKARVLAVDDDADAIAALSAAARRAQGLKPIETKMRDLFRMPLSAKELEGFDAVVFDPARSGASAQAEQLARSKVPIVAAISCNPATLARDARILVDGGYRLRGVTPIDQFLFSAHVEAVAVFERAG
ncbi:MAG TPA: class I SAM-dependent RNA methyltransferase [Hyphomicrobiaceae bacterium]|nr:class I SAM-dependent RNA methyltransferase [Hyphomicrobiaceae bacterium]